MKYSHFDPGKNDFFFAFVIAAVFVVTVAGAVVGYVDLAREHADAESAKVREAPVALDVARGHGSELAGAGAAR
jgi:hypothetical protein